MTVAALVLAAGASRRLGQPKQLLPIGGEPLVRRIAQRALAACDVACVVVGAGADEVIAALGELAVAFTHAPDWREGMGASLRRGVAWATAAGHDAVAVLTCDQPRLTIEHVRRLVEHHRATGGVVASRYAGTIGVPAVFPRWRFADLLALRGDRGARSLVRSDPDALALDWPDGEFDLDTPDDLQSFPGG